MALNEKALDEAIRGGIGTFPYFRPENQLPFPAVAGMILLTKSDFTCPARPDLLKWDLIENVVGVSNIKLEVNDNIVTLYKYYKDSENGGFSWQAVGTIGNLTEEEAQKLQAINYVRYNLIVNLEDHSLKFIGYDKDDNETILQNLSYVSYNEYNERLNTDEANISNNAGAISNLQDGVDVINNEITGIKGRLDTDEANIVNNTEAINDLGQQVGIINNGLTNLLSDFNLLDDYVDTTITPVINILRQATNPFLVLRKTADGLGIEWANILSLNDVTAEPDTQNHLINLYKFVNGVKSLVCQITDIDYTAFETLQNKITEVANNLDESSTTGYVLTKIDNTHYDWREINLINYYTKSEVDVLLSNKLSLSNIVELTYAEYQALENKNPDTYYIITDRV